MDVIDDLPATDAMRVAAYAGVDLDRLGSIAAHAGQVATSSLSAVVPFPTTDDPFGAIGPRGWVAVAVHPTRRHRPAARLAPWAPRIPGLDHVALAETLAADDAAADQVTAHHALRVLTVPTAPLSHPGHHGRRCETSTEAACWAACAARVVAAASELASSAECATSRLAITPLLAPPPPGTDPRAVADVDRAFRLAFGDFDPGVVLAPSLVASSRV